MTRFFIEVNIKKRLKIKKTIISRQKIINSAKAI